MSVTMTCEDCHTWESTSDLNHARQGLLRHWMRECPVRKPPEQRRQFPFDKPMPKKFPVLLEAMIFTRETVFDVMTWLKSEGIDSYASVFINAEPPFVERLTLYAKDHTTRGTAKPGDFIVQILPGDFFVISSEDFEAAQAREGSKTP